MQAPSDEAAQAIANGWD